MAIVYYDSSTVTTLVWGSDHLEEELRQLLHQLSPERTMKKTDFEYSRASVHVFAVYAVDDQAQALVGYGELHTIARANGRKGLIESIVVDTYHRRKGIAKTIVTCLLDAAKDRKLETVRLTSSDKRETAQKLYRKLGFKERNTRVFDIDPKGSS